MCIRDRSDSYIVLPYDILFLREVVHNAIYGKREAKQIYMEELGDLAGQIVCTTTEQADFIRKLLKAVSYTHLDVYKRQVLS